MKKSLCCPAIVGYGIDTLLSLIEARMQIKRITKIIVALLVLTFVGQTVASVHMTCSDPASSPQSSNTSVMDHSQHMNMAADSDLDSSEHCSVCVCGPGGCSTALLPAYQSPFVASIRLAVNLPAYFAESQPASSLYHPPLFR